MHICYTIYTSLKHIWMNLKRKLWLFYGDIILLCKYAIKWSIIFNKIDLWFKYEIVISFSNFKEDTFFNGFLCLCWNFDIEKNSHSFFSLKRWNVKCQISVWGNQILGAKWTRSWSFICKMIDFHSRSKNWWTVDGFDFLPFRYTTTEGIYYDQFEKCVRFLIFRI